MVTSAERAAAAARSRRLVAPWRGGIFGLGGSRRRYDFYDSPESSDYDDVDDAGLPWAWHDAAPDDAADAADDVAEAEPRAVHAADERAPYLDLPLPLLRALLAGLPVDVRLRCREVCPGWRDVLRPAALWTHVDISNRSGVAALPTEAFMVALSRASRHRMAALHAHGCGALLSRTLRRVVSSNARTLRSVDITTGKPALQQMAAQRAAVQRALAVGDFASVMAAASATVMTRDLPELRCVARAGSALEALHVDVRADARHATLLLSNQYGALRARTLNAQSGFVEHGVVLDDPRASRVAHIAEALPMHPSLRRLELTSAPLAPDNRAADAQAAADDPNVVAFGMLCDALAASPVDELVLSSCACCAASQAHLGRLLGAGTLRYLTLCAGSGYGAPAGADGEEAQAPPLARPEPALAAGLRGSSLARLTMMHVGLFDNAASANTLRALAGHATLRTLDVHDNVARGARACRAAGAALAAVLAADGLEELNCDSCKLGGEAMAPLFAALGAATRLRKLSVACNGLGERDVTKGLAPALRGCALEELRVRCGDCDGPCSAAYAAGQAAGQLAEPHHLLCTRTDATDATRSATP